MKKRDFLKKGILISMRVYHRKSTQERVIRDILNDFDYLYKRGLYKMAEKELKRAKDKAFKINALPYLIRINELERLFYSERKQDRKYETEIKNRIEEQKSIHGKLNDYFKFRNLHDRILAKFRLGEFDEDLASTLEKTSAPSSGADFSIWKFFFLSKAQIALQAGNWTDAYDCYDRLINLYHHWNRTDGEYAAEFCRVQSNFLECLWKLEDWNEVEKVLLDMEERMEKSGKEMSLDDLGEYKQCWILYKLLFIYNMKMWDGVNEIIDQAESILRDWVQKINLSRKLSIMMNLALLCFVQERWEESDKWFRNVLSQKKSKIRPTFIKIAHLLLVVICYEQERLDDFESKYRTAQRSEPSEFSLEILKKVRKIMLKGLMERKAEFGKLANYIAEKNANLPLKTSRNGFAELYSWAKSRENSNHSILQVIAKFPWPPPPNSESDATPL